MNHKRVLSVGQCMADHAGIAHVLGQAFAVDVVPADTVKEATQLLRDQVFALVLANRIFDRDGASGLDFIRRMKANPTTARVPVMLVSNYTDAQSQAVQAGAVPGFGKSALGDVAMLERLQTILGT